MSSKESTDQLSIYDTLQVLNFKKGTATIELLKTHFPSICWEGFWPPKIPEISGKPSRTLTNDFNHFAPWRFIRGVSISSKIEIILRIARSQKTIEKIHFVTDKLHII